MSSGTVIPVVVHFLNRQILAESAVAAVGDEMCAAARQADCFQLVVDLSGVELLSSAMIDKLITVRTIMGQKGGVLKLCGGCPNVRSMFKLEPPWTTYLTVGKPKPAKSDCLIKRRWNS